MSNNANWEKVLNSWKLGEKRITNTTHYKYLGDTITNDNKNKRNLEIRENRIQSTIRQINTTASSDVMRGVETAVLLTRARNLAISWLDLAKSGGP